MELEAKYDALKKQSSKAYIAEGKCWDDTDSDEDDSEICNYALMAHSREDDESLADQVPSLTTVNMSLLEYKSTIEKLSVEMFNLHTSLTASNEELAKVNSRNAELFKRNEELESVAVELKILGKR